MDWIFKKASAGLITVIILFFVFIMFSFPANLKAVALTGDQIRDVIKESVQLLVKGKEPTEKQTREIQNLSEMIKSGEISKKDIHRITKKQVFEDLPK